MKYQVLFSYVIIWAFVIFGHPVFYLFNVQSIFWSNGLIFFQSSGIDLLTQLEIYLSLFILGKTKASAELKKNAFKKKPVAAVVLY